MRISENQAVLKDHWLASYLDNQEISFYDVKFDYNFVYQQTSDQAPILSFWFFINNNVETVERKCYNVYDALSNTGGIMGIVYGIASWIMSFIDESLFFSVLMKHLFLHESSQKRKTTPI